MLLALGVCADSSAREQTAGTLRSDIDALHAALVTAFTRDPAGECFYSDAAAIIGGGQRIQGRTGVDAYWKGATMRADWSLQTLETGGPADAPWAYRRSVLLSRSGLTIAVKRGAE